MRFIIFSMLFSFLVPTIHAKRKTVFYEGSLLDEDSNPVSGIFHLQFSLYRVPKGGKKIWTEKVFVSVAAGKYVIELGRKNPIPHTFRLNKYYIGISIPDGLEFFRAPFKEVKIISPSEFAKMKQKYTNAIPVEKTGSSNNSPSGQSYAEKAGIAFEAEHAKNSDKLENFSLKEIEQLLSKKIKVKVGNGDVFSEQVGGTGGADFFVTCPKGQVVVGVRGGAGKYLDRLQLICAPLK